MPFIQKWRMVSDIRKKIEPLGYTISIKEMNRLFSGPDGSRKLYGLYMNLLSQPNRLIKALEKRNARFKEKPTPQPPPRDPNDRFFTDLLPERPTGRDAWGPGAGLPTGDLG